MKVIGFITIMMLAGCGMNVTMRYLFPSSVAGGPGNQIAHDYRGDETIDPATGIGEADGQLLDNTSIDPTTQEKAKGFPK